jgi:hypothetical protein
MRELSWNEKGAKFHGGQDSEEVQAAEPCIYLLLLRAAALHRSKSASLASGSRE